jgi:hypothetical protein
MIGFKQFLLETGQLDERVVRTGASLAFAAQGRRHGEEAVQAYKAAKQALTGYAFKSGEERVDAVADALIKLLDGLIATRRQIGAGSGQLTLK